MTVHRMWLHRRMLLTRHDRVRSLPIGTAHGILALGVISSMLGVVLLLSLGRLTSPAFHLARELGIAPLSVVFLVIGIGLLTGYKTGYGLIFWLRAHSFYWAFWAVMYLISAWLYDSPAAAVPVYLGMASWSMLLVATIKQWRRLEGLL